MARLVFTRTFLWSVSTAVVLLGACTTGGGHGDLGIVPTPQVAKAPMTTDEMIAALDKYAPLGSPSGEALADLHQILRAQREESLNHGPDAVKLWFDALAKAKGRFGDEALRGWIHAYTTSLGKKTDLELLTRLLMAETRQGQQSPYMIKNGLTTPESIAGIVRRTVPDLLEATPGQESTPLAAPVVEGVPTDDPLMVKLIADRCRAAAVDTAGWDAWQKTLPRATAMLWLGMIDECKGNSASAIRFYRSAFEAGVTDKTSAAVALQAQAKLVSAMRARGEREAAADAYMPLVRQWEAAGVTAPAMGLSPIDFDVRRMDEILWAARYRAMVGDHESSKIYAQRVVDLVAKFLAEHPVFSSSLREQVAAFRVDALHTIAFRAAVERGEWDSALSLMTMALQTPDMTTEWKERLVWFAGLYEYMAGRYDDARRRWEGALRTTRDDSVRSRHYFWIGRSLLAMKRPDEAKHYFDLLSDEYPLSFYTVVGLPMLSGKEGAAWRGDGFPDGEELADLLKTRRFSEADAFEAGTDMWKSIRRAEVLTSVRMDKWARLASQDLDDAVRALPGGVEARPGLYVYLSRLHYSVGNYVETIRLTSDLVRTVPGFWHKWPEQVLVYFPRPYYDVYRRRADESHMDVEQLLAISRQESSFTPAVKSPAGAIGLMQLMPYTASKYADGLQVSSDAVAARLVEPDINIAIGTAYMKQLQLRYKNVSPAVYGAYNAGEFAVDGWLERRPSKDLLVWIEMIPFSETKDYVKNVWRNAAVYRVLSVVP